MNAENKMSLIFYAIGTIAGIVSGVLSTQVQAGYIVGLLVYLLSPKIVIALVKDLPDELKDERVLLRKGFWGFFLFWLYFTIFSYNLILQPEPTFYSNQSLLYNITKG
ncbi:MAG: hypothetical protein PWP49_997 [Thermococcaceae archaeon]|uniref:hypothetical protein n=1 Tax=Thermococcus sp. 101 C5 TaxID=2654197 RepID=UPI001327F606|nr:hypothetical protein [Thermococcaceae archaeon]MPW38741.1 hypothetical protein [Thermococcus sp. 101 C5]MDK2854703.1 hypothetical protein [Thermococcaceae archaeon]MDK2983791.1 hypothetical protein [Thermococcaceae archaeon]MDN5320577.1 hypothetical protein [Thermococcaceae archaeon]